MTRPHAAHLCKRFDLQSGGSRRRRRAPAAAPAAGHPGRAARPTSGASTQCGVPECDRPWLRHPRFGGTVPGWAQAQASHRACGRGWPPLQLFNPLRQPTQECGPVGAAARAGRGQRSSVRACKPARLPGGVNCRLGGGSGRPARPGFEVARADGVNSAVAWPAPLASAGAARAGPLRAGEGAPLLAPCASLPKRAHHPARRPASPATLPSSWC